MQAQHRKYFSDITSVSDYYPFGSPLYGRRWSAGYRYGFNGKENDNEIYGVGNAYDFGDRMYDARLGRWWSVDKKYIQYSNFSPYIFSENNPIYFKDVDGKDAIGQVKGNTITISTVIYIHGDGATKEKAAQMQREIMNYYKDSKYVDESGKEYNVKFDIQVKAITSKNMQVNEATNIVRLTDKKIGNDDRSRVTEFTWGLWKTNDKPSTYAHETGHLLGLADRYVDLVPDNEAENSSIYDIMGKRFEHSEDLPGVSPNDLMGMGANSKNSSIQQDEVNAIAKFVLENKDKNGKAVINKQSLLKYGYKEGLGYDDDKFKQKQDEASKRGYKAIHPGEKEK